MTRIGEILDALRDGESTLEDAAVAVQRARHDHDLDELELASALGRLVEAGDLTAAAAARLSSQFSAGTQGPTRLRPGIRTPDTGALRQASLPHRNIATDSLDAGDWAEPQVLPVRLGVGDVLRDRFVIEEAIGEGGMGLVFRARDRRREEALDRNPFVAIKFLSDQVKSHPDALIALQREARRMQQLSHPNIASVYDFDRDGAHVYLVMELLEGDSLDRVLERTPGAGLPTELARRLIEQAGNALRHAHSKGVVHSDFKPANVFLMRSGEVKIIDFGIARIAKDSTQGADAPMTVFDAGRLGAYTNAYASPEQILATEDPHPKDDVYSFGLVVYEALTGRHPFGSKSALEARFRELKVDPIPGLSAQQNSLLAAALSFDRALRLEGVARLVQAFALNDDPIIPMRDVLRPRRTSAVSDDTSGDRRRQLGVAALAVAGVAGLAYYFVSHRTPQVDEPVSATATGRPLDAPAVTTPIAASPDVTATKTAARAADQPDATVAPTQSAMRAGSAAPVVANAPPAVGNGAVVQTPLGTKAAPQGLAKGPPPAAGNGAVAQTGIATKAAPQDVAKGPPPVAAAPAAGRASAAAPAAKDATERSLYRWVDKDGNVQFGEKPPPEYADVAVKVVDM